MIIRFLLVTIISFILYLKNEWIRIKRLYWAIYVVNEYMISTLDTLNGVQIN